MRISDWSSDVCSSDLPDRQRRAAAATAAQPRTVRAGSRVLGAIAAGRRCDGLSGAGAGAVQESLVSRGARSDVAVVGGGVVGAACALARSEEHTSELQSLMRTSYAVFCLKKKNSKITTNKKNQTALPMKTTKN